MHKIISTTGAPIEFVLTSNKNFVIDPVNPIEVTAEELISLLERLGSQISEVAPEPVADDVTPVETVVSPEPEAQAEQDTAPVEAEPEA